MSNDSNADDYRSTGTTLNFIISCLKEHEQKLDNLINKLTKIKPQTDSKKELYSHLDKLDCSVSNLEKDIKHLAAFVVDQIKVK